MAAEGLQYAMLVKQNLANTWRLAAFRKLLESKAPSSGNDLLVGGVQAYRTLPTHPLILTSWQFSPCMCFYLPTPQVPFALAAFGPREITLRAPLVLALPELVDRDLDNPDSIEGSIAVVLTPLLFSQGRAISQPALL